MGLSTSPQSKFDKIRNGFLQTADPFDFCEVTLRPDERGIRPREDELVRSGLLDGTGRRIRRDAQLPAKPICPPPPVMRAIRLSVSRIGWPREAMIKALAADNHGDSGYLWRGRKQVSQGPRNRLCELSVLPLQRLFMAARSVPPRRFPPVHRAPSGCVVNTGWEIREQRGADVQVDVDSEGQRPLIKGSQRGNLFCQIRGC